jgi:hypothetical protein
MNQPLQHVARVPQAIGRWMLRPILAAVDRQLFMAKIEALHWAARQHEINGIPNGDTVYQRLYAEAVADRQAFAEKWSVDALTIHARIAPGLEHLRLLAGAERP